MEKRLCPECGDEIIGRVDKRFCCDQCRNNFNNKQNRTSTNFMRNENAILKKNRRILMELNPDGKAKVHRDKMVEKGFSFNHLTRIYTTRKGEQYFFSYEYGYKLLDNDWVIIVFQD